jgi:hypothetical protein
MCGRYASFLPAEAMRRTFRTVNPLPNLEPSLERRSDAISSSRAPSSRDG